jgi:hypothetical protein
MQDEDHFESDLAAILLTVVELIPISLLRTHVVQQWLYLGT